MSHLTFSKSFTQQEPLPQEAIDSAVEVMRGGRLHRYNVKQDEISHAALLEHEFAGYQNSKYCLACTSGGYALHIALRCLGIRYGEPVLTNAFTLAPVPGAIHNAGAKPVLVETRPDLTIDLNDLEEKARRCSARFLMLSHMRGHIADMDAITAICAKYGIELVEDCAHTMGASWKNTKSGNFGKVACFSSQTYKHLNSGEGGFLITNDAEIMARAVIHSGSYMLYESHLARPEKEVFESVKLETPNYSGRMDNLRAAILRVQLKHLDTNCRRWNRRYRVLADKLEKIQGISIPRRSADEHYVGSSIQFSINADKPEKIIRFIDTCYQRGVEIKWFGASEPKGFTSRFDSWRYFDNDSELPNTMKTLSNLCDMRVPLTFSEADCVLIGDIIEQVVSEIN